MHVAVAGVLRRMRYAQRGPPIPTAEHCDIGGSAPAVDVWLGAVAAGRAARRSSGSLPEVWPPPVAAGHARQGGPRDCSPHSAVAQRTARAADHCTAGTTPDGCPARSTVSRTGSTPESRHQPSQDTARRRRSPPDRDGAGSTRSAVGRQSRRRRGRRGPLRHGVPISVWRGRSNIGPIHNFHRSMHTCLPRRISSEQRWKLFRAGLSVDNSPIDQGPR
jgi:hypothetical protein